MAGRELLEPPTESVGGASPNWVVYPDAGVWTICRKFEISDMVSSVHLHCSGSTIERFFSFTILTRTLSGSY